MNQLRLLLLALIPFCALLITGCSKTEEANPSGRLEYDEPDVSLEFELESPSSISRTIVKIKDSRVRSDSEDGLFSSILTNEGDYFLLNHNEKTFEKVVDDFPEAMPPDTDDALLEKAFKMQFTDRKRKIGDWECMEFVMVDSMELDVHSSEKSKITAWIATDFREGVNIQNRMDRLRGGHFHNFLRHFKNKAGKDFHLPGMAIMVERTNARGLSARNTCKRITFGAIPDKVFEIPKNYAEIDGRRSD